MALNRFFVKNVHKHNLGGIDDDFGDRVSVLCPQEPRCFGDVSAAVASQTYRFRLSLEILISGGAVIQEYLR